MSDVEALGEAMMAAHACDWYEPATILAALHESGWTVERAGEVSRLRAWVPRIVWSEAFHELLRMGEREDHAMARADLVRMGVERAWDERAGDHYSTCAALAQPAPDATPCAECGHLCDATFCGCVAACKAHQS